MQDQALDSSNGSNGSKSVAFSIERVSREMWEKWRKRGKTQLEPSEFHSLFLCFFSQIGSAFIIPDTLPTPTYYTESYSNHHPFHSTPCLTAPLHFELGFRSVYQGLWGYEAQRISGKRIQMDQAKKMNDCFSFRHVSAICLHIFGTKSK